MHVNTPKVSDPAHRRFAPHAVVTNHPSTDPYCSCGELLNRSGEGGFSQIILSAPLHDGWTLGLYTLPSKAKVHDPVPAGLQAAHVTVRPASHIGGVSVPLNFHSLRSYVLHVAPPVHVSYVKNPSCPHVIAVLP